MTRAFRLEKDHVALFLRVTPNASKNEIRGLWRGPEGEDRLVIRVTAPPDKGRANKAVVKLIAATLGLPKSSVSITAGEKDRLKTVAIEGDSGDIIERLEALLSAGDKGDRA